jgi:hypothetical protein
MADRLAAFFKARPGEWIDGLQLAEIAGSYAWRSRVSDVRRGPHGLNIQNRLRRVERSDGTHYTVSEYRLVPGSTTPQAVVPAEMTKTTTLETTRIVSSGLPL